MSLILAPNPRNVNLLSDDAAAEFGQYLSDADRLAEAEMEAQRDLMDLLAGQWGDHLEAEAEDAHWAELAEEAAIEAAWGRSCELGYLAC